MPKKAKGAVIISGASRGIGAAIAEALSSSGYPVVINFLEHEKLARALENRLNKKKKVAYAAKADVSNRNDVRKMVSETIDKFGAIDGIVNNATGKCTIKDFEHLNWSDFQFHIDIQLKGAFNMIQAALPHFLNQKYGIIVNIASIYADAVPPKNEAPYNTVKGAIVTLSRSLAVEYGPRGIRVNTVSPGMTETDLTADISEHAKTIVKMSTPLRRLAQPADIAHTVDFLFSDKASHITGENIRVCGGAVME